MSTEETLLSVRDLKISFGKGKKQREVVHGVSFDVYAGETVAIVGESGSGKSTTAAAVIDLLPGTGEVTSGSVKLNGRELTTLKRADMERLRGREIGYVPQDPMSNLNPVWSIGFQVKETVKANGLASSRRDVHKMAVEMQQTSALTEHAPVVEVKDLVKEYQIRGGGLRSTPFRAVDGVSFQIPKGKTLALVGESGSGKSTVAKMVLQLEKPTSGSVLIEGRETTSMSRKDVFDLRSRMQPVFQDPYGSLDPMRSLGALIAEPLKIHGVGDAASRRARVHELLEQVALPVSLAERYPNELSGGQRQRIAVARALALKPSIIVLDEAVSALDVLVQDQILQLLSDLQSELDLTYLFITHDLAVVRVAADLVAVMEKGRIVEQGTVDRVFANPEQEYTQRLLNAIPGKDLKLGAA